jgi:hypothetical protein
MRPIFEGGWTQAHIDWFKEEFKKETGEIAARKVQQMFGSRIGDIFPDSYKKSYVFRDLMRCVVEDGKARVTQSFSWSKDYRIKMVSESHRYVEEVFDEDIFSHPYINEPLRNYVDLMSNIVLTGEFGSSIKIARLDDTSRRFKKAFLYYQYGGGDIESVFEEFHEKYVEKYVLEAFELICMYKLLKVVCSNLTEYRLYDYNKIFASTFHFKFVSKLLVINGSKNKYSKSYTDRNIRETLTALINDSEPSKQRVVNMKNTMFKTFGIDDKHPSISDYVHYAASGAWLMEMTKNSGDRQVKEARTDWISKLDSLFKYDRQR